MLFVISLLIILDTSSIAFPPLLVVSVPVTYLFIREFRKHRKARLEREAFTRWHNRCSFWVS